MSSVSFSFLSPLLGVLASPSPSLKLSALLGVLGSPSPARLPLLLMGPSEPMRDRLVSRFTALMELRLRGTMGLCRSRHQPDLGDTVGIRRLSSPPCRLRVTFAHTATPLPAPGQSQAAAHAETHLEQNVTWALDAWAEHVSVRRT